MQTVVRHEVHVYTNEYVECARLQTACFGTPKEWIMPQKKHNTKYVVVCSTSWDTCTQMQTVLGKSESSNTEAAKSQSRLLSQSTLDYIILYCLLYSPLWSVPWKTISSYWVLSNRTCSVIKLGMQSNNGLAYWSTSCEKHSKMATP